jgi:hypothetical protein
MDSHPDRERAFRHSGPKASGLTVRLAGIDLMTRFEQRVIQIPDEPPRRASQDVPPSFC